MKLRVIGLTMVGVLAGTFLLTAALYNQVFASTVDISVRTSRSGLIMDPGNKVKYRGIEIGRIRSVDKTDEGALLELAIESDRADDVARNVTAEIRASTIFGAKYVELVDVAERSDESIASGTVIDATGVTREINTLFERLDDVMSTVDVVAVNTTLGSLSDALEGRGDDIAELAVTADRYLTELEPSLPQLRRDLRELAHLSALGVRTEPALIRILNNATTTSRTIANKQAALDRLLVDAALLGQTGTAVLGVNTDPLVYALGQLRPTSQTLATYAAELPCFLRGLERSGKLAAAAAGGTSPGINVLATLRTQIRPYDSATDKPQRLRGSGPVCGPLPYLAGGDIPVTEIGGE